MKRTSRGNGLKVARVLCLNPGEQHDVGRIKVAGGLKVERTKGGRNL